MAIGNAQLEALMTEYEVARLLNVSVATIRRRRLLRQPPAALKIGASVRYKPETIRRFVESGNQADYSN
jgi:hypothetical protein